MFLSSIWIIEVCLGVEMLGWTDEIDLRTATPTSRTEAANIGGRTGGSSADCQEGDCPVRSGRGESVDWEATGVWYTYVLLV